MDKPAMPVWHDGDGQVLSCTEKIKVMSENMDELWQMLQDVFEDALLMGGDEQQIRSYFAVLVSQLCNPYRKD